MGVVDGAGCWAWVGERDLDHAPRPALFVDRDGVVVHERVYLRRREDVELLPAAAETVATFNATDVPVIVVTNQSGVARGYLDWKDFECVQAEVERQLRDATGAHLDGVFACAYHEDGLGALAVGDHEWRKPNPGMLLAAAESLGVCLRKSWIVGDRSQDIAAGRAAGLAGGLHVSSGHGDAAEQQDSLMLADSNFEVKCAADIGGAVELLGAFSQDLTC
jgi:D-glycero-D-manno-heptose 1,7-bisphosphate phosphatase